MNHRMLRMPAGWEWHMLTDGRVPSDWPARPRTGSAASGTERPWPGTDRPWPGTDHPRPGTGPAGSGQPGLAGVGKPGTANAGGPGAADTDRSGAAGSAEPGPAPAESGQEGVRQQAESGTHAPSPADVILVAGMTRAAALAEVKRRLPECANWLDDAVERQDALAVSTETPEAGDTVYGTLPLRMSADERDVCPFHFWLTEKRIVTLQFDLRFTLRLQRSPWEERIGRARNAPEAFAVILTAALETLRGGFESFERRLAGLEAEAERTGRPIPRETAAELQRGLLQWNRHLLAVVEAESAAAESFGGLLTDSEPYRRLQRRLSLVRALIGRCAEALETLALLGGGAETRKSGARLRAFAAVAWLPVPAAAAGALWGLHAGGVPVADEPWGFSAVCGGAALLSLIAHLWLRRMARDAEAGAREGAKGRGAAAPGRPLAGKAPGGAGPAFGQGGGQNAGQGGPAGLPSRSKRMKRR